ncbi:DNA cytosine methyltransferase [Paenibacillus sp. YN15]|uniref:DNA cytosine methyltransferase n=1 Tax=Paenibacillus sp. YN15 TaxID=1742774 RepID=UPI000DCCE68B|nr:DNA cytosine methyltransferase [Paenibacillus sp. YN15]RAU96824.1 hypothetical protein DQG13_19920 [Paenibacillus sp. YN15]
MIANHNPQPLSAAVAQKMVDGGYAEYIRKHPIARMSEPSPAVLTQWAKGAPNGLVDISEKAAVITENHVGYDLRNDERPFAHKIPPGGNWRDLSEIEQAQFMGGALRSGGGKVGYLRRERWDDASHTVLAAPMAKATCQLHPGQLDEKETITLRNYNVTPALPSNGLTVVELFCGGGLMGVGLAAAGYDIIFANDFDKNAVKAYAHNLGNHVICGDITSDDVQQHIPDADIIAGGPPCQDYSVAGTGAGEDGERGRLVWTYLNVIERKQPKAFVFENVKGLIAKKHRATFDALLAEFERIGYAVSWRLINAWDYGVAQKRERVFIVGIRKDLGFTFAFPEPDASGYRTQVLRDVIGDLPEPNSGVNAHIQTQATTVKPEHSLSNQRGYVANWDAPGKTVCTNRLDHAEIHPGPDNHDRASLTEGAIRGAQRRQAQGNFQSALRTSKWEEPAYTITTQLAKDPTTYVPPTPQPRRFTVRECLRIQSVPDSYVFPDTISLSAQYRIVGNGVASRVAYLIGSALAEQLNAALAKNNAEEAVSFG